MTHLVTNKLWHVAFDLHRLVTSIDILYKEKNKIEGKIIYLFSNVPKMVLTVVYHDLFTIFQFFFLVCEIQENVSAHV